MAEASQRVFDSCASFALYLATFRRNAKSSTKTVDELRSELHRELERLERVCRADPEISIIWERLRYALVTTADQVVLSSPWSHRAKWSMQLLEADVYGTREGGQRFFQLVEETLQDSSSNSRVLAVVLFHCMALGFQGELRNDRAALESFRQRLGDKSGIHSRSKGRLTPEAYEANSNRSVAKLPTVGLVRLSVVALAALVFAIVAASAATSIKSADIVEEIEAIRNDLEPK